MTILSPATSSAQAVVCISQINKKNADTEILLPSDARELKRFLEIDDADLPATSHLDDLLYKHSRTAIFIA
jgi:hypothetical protein